MAGLCSATAAANPCSRRSRCTVPSPKLVLKELGVDIARFETAFERDLYPSLGLSRGVFFPREHFGRDVLVNGDPMAMVERRHRAGTPQRQAGA